MNEASVRLREFQTAFARALMGGVDPGESGLLATLIAQPGFAVYRNTVLKGCIDTLQANFPTVARLVGDDWFRAAAAEFARCTLPDQPTLLLYGQEFTDFLRDFPPAAELPYLCGVAHLDRLWSECHVAADGDALTI